VGVCLVRMFPFCCLLIRFVIVITNYVREGPPINMYIHCYLLLDCTHVGSCNVVYHISIRNIA
jgi:hypothetical protein